MNLTINHVISFSGTVSAEVLQLTQKVNQIMSTQAEIVTLLTAAADQANKSRAEVIATVEGLKAAVASLEMAVAAAVVPSPELIAAAEAVKFATQALDDLNADPVVIDPVVIDPVAIDPVAIDPALGGEVAPI